MAIIKSAIQIVSPLGYASPYSIEKFYKGNYRGFLSAKLHMMQEIRKIATKEDFLFANIILRTKEKQQVSIMKIVRDRKTIYVQTIEQVVINIPIEYQKEI